VRSCHAPRQFLKGLEQQIIVRPASQPILLQPLPRRKLQSLQKKLTNTSDGRLRDGTYLQEARTFGFQKEKSMTVMTEISSLPNARPGEGASSEEVNLGNEIVELCEAHKRKRLAAGRTRGEMLATRDELGKKLHALKLFLARRGRGGQWTHYLNSAGLPKTTADRYVAKYEASLETAAPNLPNGEIKQPAEDATAQFIKQIMPKIRKALTTRDAVWDLVSELVELPITDAEWTDSGVLFHRPSPVSADCEHREVGVQEPAPLVQ
jgi:hypothetical protein